MRYLRLLSGAFTSYSHKDYQGDPGARISTGYSDWAANTANGDANNAWISPTDFVQAMHDDGAQFDAIAMHPYAPTMDGDPLAQPPAGAISLGNIGTLLAQLRTLYPNGQKSAMARSAHGIYAAIVLRPTQRWMGPRLLGAMPELLLRTDYRG